MKKVKIEEAQICDVVELKDGSIKLIHAIGESKQIYARHSSCDLNKICTCSNYKLKSNIQSHAYLDEILSPDIKNIYRLEVNDIFDEKLISSIDISKGNFTQANGMVIDVEKQFKNIDYSQADLTENQKELVVKLTQHFNHIKEKKSFDLDDHVCFDDKWHVVVGVSVAGIYIEDSSCKDTLSSLTVNKSNLTYKPRFENRGARFVPFSETYKDANFGHLKFDSQLLTLTFKVGDRVCVDSGVRTNIYRTESQNYTISKINGQRLYFQEGGSEIGHPAIISKIASDAPKLKAGSIIKIDGKLVYIKDRIQHGLHETLYEYTTSSIQDGTNIDNVIYNYIPHHFFDSKPYTLISESFKPKFKIGEVVDASSKHLNYLNLVDKKIQIIAILKDGSVLYKRENGILADQFLHLNNIILKSNSFDFSKEKIGMISGSWIQYLTSVPEDPKPAPPVEKVPETQKSMFNFPNFDDIVKSIFNKLEFKLSPDFDSLFSDLGTKSDKMVEELFPEIQKKEQISQGSKIPSEAIESAYRIFGRKMSKLIHNSIILALKKYNLSSTQLQAIQHILATEYGRAFISYILGMALSKSKYANHPKMGKIIEELQIEGALVSIENLSSGIESILFSALKQSPSLEPNQENSSSSIVESIDTYEDLPEESEKLKEMTC